MKLPLIGSRYQRNRLTQYPALIWGLPVRVTVLDNKVEYFGCPAVLLQRHCLLWAGPDRDKFRENLEVFLELYHPIENVVRLKS